MGGYPLGLDYAQIEPVARLAGIALDAEAFADLQAMEDAALAVFAEADRAQAAQR